MSGSGTAHEIPGAVTDNPTRNVADLLASPLPVAQPGS